MCDTTFGLWPHFSYVFKPILDWIDSQHYILEVSNSSFRYVSLCNLDILYKIKLFAKSGDPEQTPHVELGLHCLPITFLVVARLKLVKGTITSATNDRMVIVNLYHSLGWFSRRQIDLLLFFPWNRFYLIAAILKCRVAAVKRLLRLHHSAANVLSCFFFFFFFFFF